jgi:hypothetical protein
MGERLRLPIKTYRDVDSPIVPIITELEPPVETVLDQDIQELLVQGRDEESDVNAKIIQAQMNAERNRLMSQETNYSDHDSPGRRNLSSIKSRHIRFGSEIEMEFEPGKSTKVANKTINEIKSFDGSRSGRPSLKA